MMTESMTIAPSWSSVGTTPFGLSFEVLGLELIAREQVELHLVEGSPLALSTNRTRWLQVDCAAL